MCTMPSFDATHYNLRRASPSSGSRLSHWLARSRRARRSKQRNQGNQGNQGGGHTQRFATDSPLFGLPTGPGLMVLTMPLDGRRWRPRRIGPAACALRGRP